MTTWGRNLELVWMLTLRNVKIRYKNSALGFFWTLLGPVFLIAIYALFLGIMRFTVNLPLLITGIIAWHFFSMCAGDALHAILGNANLIKKTAFPRMILVLSMVLANLINFLLALVVLVIYLLLSPVTFGAWVWFLPALVTQTALCLGLSLLVSSANVFFRDTEHIMGMVMMAWFFVTPIIYPLTLVTERFGSHSWLCTLYFANPMAGIVAMYRRVFLNDLSAPGLQLLVSAGVAWAVLAAGVLIFQWSQRRFAEEL